MLLTLCCSIFKRLEGAEGSLQLLLCHSHAQALGGAFELLETHRPGLGTAPQATVQAVQAVQAVRVSVLSRAPGQVRASSSESQTESGPTALKTSCHPRFQKQFHKSS